MNSRNPAVRCLVNDASISRLLCDYAYHLDMSHAANSRICLSTTARSSMVRTSGQAGAAYVETLKGRLVLRGQALRSFSVSCTGCQGHGWFAR
ncbi:hypothetical protein Bxe_C0336 [Paraburkholderia xenovorans LB400]|uniref:Uncharacterized protein n=1 Tax=Paraburkholderia xenovorans (strain LB400) TaxID=266265 RepID=Q13I38_PARXL|nr:hypothetical protein Bxe_C0336 [Paraburkholderia xenovorans LB400]